MLQPDELHFIDADGAIVREYDDVILLAAVAPAGAGNVAPDIVRPGTSGTVVMILDDGMLDVECHVGPGEFAFASPKPDQVRLFRRREEKSFHVGH